MKMRTIEHFLPCICRGGGPCAAWWKGFSGSKNPLHRLRRSPSPRKRGEERSSPPPEHRRSLLPERRHAFSEIFRTERLCLQLRLQVEIACESIDGACSQQTPAEL